MTYAYDLNGRMISASDNSAAIPAAVPPGGAASVKYTATYSYDGRNRPTGVVWDNAPTPAAPTVSSVTFGHSYNKVNQRTGQTGSDNSWLNYPSGTGTTAYTANNLNQYTAVGGVTPTYDGNGNLTSDGTYALGYDAENRLTSSSGAGNTAAYTFDAQNRRKTKTVNGTTTVFATDADNREVLEYDSSGAILNWYAYGLGANDVLSRMELAAGTRTAFVPDLLGSTIAMMASATGALTRIGYLPYGQGNTAAPFGFTGQRVDLVSGGLYYYRARHYSPLLGRFLQVDPIGDAGGINLYAYVGNDPLNLTDPSGNVVGIDDAIAVGVGTTIGLAAQGIADLATGKLSSWRSYAAAGIGGAAGGWAALYSGGLASGAAAGAAYSVADQLLNTGSVNIGQLGFDTGISAATAGLGSRILPAATSLLPNSFKGQIGETASLAYNWLQGSSLQSTQAPIPGYRTIADSAWKSLSGELYYVESKFGSSTLTAAQRAAQSGLGDAYHVERWGYPWVGRVGANLGIGVGIGISATTSK